MEIEKENGVRSPFSFSSRFVFIRILGIKGKLVRIPLTIGFFADLFILIRDVAVM